MGFLQPGSWREALEARAAPPGAKLITFYGAGPTLRSSSTSTASGPLIRLRDRILETFTDHYSPSVQNTSTHGRGGAESEGSG